MVNMKYFIEEWKKTEYPSELVIKISKKVFKRNSKILDFGCGGGRNFFFLLDNYDAYASDIYDELIDFVRSKVQENHKKRIVKNEKTKIPFCNSYFDGILLYGVIGLLNTDERILIYKEIFRCLKDGGWFIIEYTGKNSVISSKSIEINYKLFNKEEIISEIQNISNNFDIGYEEFCLDSKVIRRWVAYGTISKRKGRPLENGT